MALGAAIHEGAMEGYSNCGLEGDPGAVLDELIRISAAAAQQPGAPAAFEVQWWCLLQQLR